MAKPTYEELELQVSQLHHRWFTQKHRADNLYDKLRRLEGKVRTTIVVGEHVDSDELYQLRRMVPNRPRPTLRELRRKGRHAA